VVNIHTINWIAPPPQRRIQVYRLRGPATLRAIAAGAALSLHMHQSPTGNVPCCCWPPPDNLCRGKYALTVTYIPVVCFDSRPLILELTGDAAGRDQFMTSPELAGTWVKVKQLGGPDQGGPTVTLLLNLARACNVVPFDPLPRLVEVWDARAKGQPDPDDQAAMLHALEGGPSP